MGPESGAAPREEGKGPERICQPQEVGDQQFTTVALV